MCIVEDPGGGSGTDEKVSIGLVVCLSEKNLVDLRLCNRPRGMSFMMNLRMDL